MCQREVTGTQESDARLTGGGPASQRHDRADALRLPGHADEWNGSVEGNAAQARFPLFFSFYFSHFLPIFYFLFF